MDEAVQPPSTADDAVVLKAQLQVALHALQQKETALQRLEAMVLDQQRLVEVERGGAGATEKRHADALAEVRRLNAMLTEELAHDHKSFQ